jgi:zinc protease
MRSWHCRRIVVAFGFLVCHALMTHAQTINVPPTHKRVLDNGLSILVREDASAPVVSVQAWVRAGSITEAEWMGAGLSHVLEHMLFKGTTTRGVAEIAQQIQAKGGYINAYTSFEQTVYYINLPSENWQTAVDILADCMMNATIPEDELLKEKQVILREMAMNRDDPDRRASRLLWSTAYTTHPYRHPVIGYPDVYEQLSRDDVVAYYKRHYVPNNMLFVVVGDVKADAVEQRIRELTKDFRRGPLPPVYVPAEPPQLALRERHEEMATDLSRINLGWHIPSVTHPDVYALDVLAIILGQGISSRLHRDLLQNRGLVHSIGAYSYTPRYPGLFAVSATADPDKRDDAIAAIREHLRRIHSEPVADAELQKAVKNSISDHLTRLKTMDGQASDIGQNELLLSNPDFSQEYLARLRQVTAHDIQRVANRHLTDSNLTIVTLNPPGRAPAPATVAVTGAEIAIQKFELPNGLRLLVREDPKLPFVDIQALLKGGVLAETDQNNGITRLTARMLLKGTTSRSADEIAESIESVGGSIRYFSGNNSFGVSTHALSDDLELALELVADVLQNPTFPEPMLARERDIQLAELKAEQDRLLRVAQQLLREAMFQRHPYRLNPTGKPETVAQLRRSDLVAFHKRFVVPNNIVLAVFGNVKADQVRQLVEKQFGAIQPVKLEFPATGPERLEQVVRVLEHRPREQAVLLLGFNGVSVHHPDRFALELLDEAYSGQGSRVFLRIRDELGLAYYVGAYNLVGLDPGYFVFYVGTTPDHVATCEQEFMAELQTLQAEGLSAEELERARASIIGQRRVKMQDNADLAMMVGLDELYGLGHDFFQTMDQRYRAVTMEDIRRAAAAYFADKPHAVVIVKPDGEPPGGGGD